MFFWMRTFFGIGMHEQKLREILYDNKVDEVVQVPKYYANSSPQIIDISPAPEGNSNASKEPLSHVRI